MNIVITGATKGIGKATAQLFAAKGFNICACSRNAAELETLKSELLQINSHIKVFVQTCDVSIKTQILDFGAFCLTHFPKIDILLNNAGIFFPGDICDEADGTLEKTLDTNLLSAYHLTRCVAPSMKKYEAGHIFNLCSVASIKPYSPGGSYGISKYALLGFSKNLREELKSFNIRVTSIIPGAVLTESWGGTTLPESRFIDVADVAHLIYNAFEISERSVVEEIIIRPLLGDL